MMANCCTFFKYYVSFMGVRRKIVAVNFAKADIMNSECSQWYIFLISLNEQAK